LVDLAEDRFHLAVFGQLKRGKSSLRNAIVGREVLPTGLLPLTSAITTLCYGLHDRLIVQRKGWSIPQEIAVAELADYVTEKGNPGNVKGVLEARLELPAAFLRRGLHFWAELAELTPTCPSCGVDLADVRQDDTEKLIAALHHPEPLTQRCAAYLLRLRAESSAVQPLIEVLDGDADVYVRAEAACSLADQPADAPAAATV
jgi:hypothetical protein